MDKILAFMVDESDNLSVSDLQKLLVTEKVATMREAIAGDAFEKIHAAINSDGSAHQEIHSELILSGPGTRTTASTPALFQLFGQRYAIDSFILSNVVFDSIDFQGTKPGRGMPKGLDVMAALGNVKAVRLLEPDLSKWNYAANLRALGDGVALLGGNFWSTNLYNLWLGALRKLDDPPAQERFPQAMRTEAWQRKQLQTPLASWAELRHDTILYVKRSHSGGTTCEYPTGYVEPYPEFYAAIKRFGEVVGKLIQEADFPAAIGFDNPRAIYGRSAHVDFFRVLGTPSGNSKCWPVRSWLASRLPKRKRTSSNEP